MITLAPRIPPVNYSKSTIACWRVVDNQVIVRGYDTTRTMSMNHILQVPLEYFTLETTLEQAKGLLYALIAEGLLEQTEIDAIYTVFPPQ